MNQSTKATKRKSPVRGNPLFGPLPEWIPNLLAYEFSQERAELLSEFSEEKVLQYVKEYEKRNEPVNSMPYSGDTKAFGLEASIRTLRKATSSDEAAHNLSIVNPDTQPGILPDLGTTEGQQLFDQVISDDVSLIIIDNLSAWCRDGRESADTWTKILPWALKHRSEGRAIVFVHHAGKNKTQRGTSKREDQVDFTIALRRPKNYKVEDDAFFEVHFEKNRQLAGDVLQPFEARYAPDKNDVWQWVRAPITIHPDPDEEQVVALLKKGKKQAVIAKKTGKKPYTITRIKQKAEKLGWL